MGKKPLCDPEEFFNDVMYRSVKRAKNYLLGKFGTEIKNLREENAALKTELAETQKRLDDRIEAHAAAVRERKSYTVALSRLLKMCEGGPDLTMSGPDPEEMVEARKLLGPLG